MTSCLRVVLLTVRIVPPLSMPIDAAMVAVPGDSALAVPVLSTVATPPAEDDQSATGNRIVLLSLSVPVAVNCWANPIGNDALAGVTVIAVRLRLDTVTVAEPEIAPALAVMLAVPAATVVTTPVLATVATLPALEVQVTCVR